MKKTLLLVFIALAVIFSLHAQEKVIHSCYMDELIKVNLKKNPSMADEYYVQEKNIHELEKALLENPNAFKGVKTDTLINGKRIIPVVFHVIHIGGTENISKEQIQDAVYHMNLDYNHLNADTASTFSQFKSRASSFDIEFRLAKIDPWGNCTDGIDRVYDPATDYAQYNVMTANSWPYSKYMNVYTVKFIYPEGMDLPDGALIGGLSPFTPDNTLSGTGGDTLKDGVLVRHDAVGTIGTATSFAGYPGYNNQNRVMTHETGHFLNLYHTFQDIYAMLAGGDGCGIDLGFMWLGSGDEVDDTPPVAQASQGCPTPGGSNTCTRSISGYGDEPDMTENYMDYASGWCQNAFTTGQKTRIDATLAGTRKNLWSYENLVATGVLDTTPQLCAPIADFYYNRTMICEGGTITFSDWSYNGEADAWEWSFDGGTPATSTEQNPTITYNTAGVYNVTLKAINTTGDNSITKTALIKVSAISEAHDGAYYEDFESAALNPEWMINNQNGNTWAVTDSAAFDGTYSMMISNFGGNARFSDDEFVTQPFDLTSFSTIPKLKFDVAYAAKRKISTNPLTSVTDTIDYYDNLKVYASYNCGQTWMQIYNKSTTLPTVAITESLFTPTSSTDWREETISLSAFSSKTNVRFKFFFNSQGGNDIFIDNINIDIPTSVEDIISNFNVSIMPNPMKDQAELSFETEDASNVSVKIFDIVGKEVSSVFDGKTSAGIHKYTINGNDLNSSGIYMVKVTIDGYEVVKKVVYNK